MRLRYLNERPKLMGACFVHIESSKNQLLPFASGVIETYWDTSCQLGNVRLKRRDP